MFNLFCNFLSPAAFWLYTGKLEVLNVDFYIFLLFLFRPKIDFHFNNCLQVHLSQFIAIIQSYSLWQRRCLFPPANRLLDLSRLFTSCRSRVLIPRTASAFPSTRNRSAPLIILISRVFPSHLI